MPETVDFVMLVDGLRYRIRGEGWVQYTVALKPTSDSVAYFMDPIFISGPESAPNWRTVFDMLPSAVALRIRGLVSDGLRGMKELAASKGWAYQRCHYHLWALLRPWMWILRRKGAGAILDAVSVGLTAPERESAEAARASLRAYVTANPGGVSGALKQLLRDWAAARCHLDHPDLQIPTTTNAVESMHRLMRDSLSGTNTLDGIMRRATALTRLHPPFTCNGHVFQQN
jgi:transposase-like protein